MPSSKDEDLPKYWGVHSNTRVRWILSSPKSCRVHSKIRRPPPRWSSNFPKSYRVQMYEIRPRCSKTWIPSLKMKIFLSLVKGWIHPYPFETWMASLKIRIKICPSLEESGCTRFVQNIPSLGWGLSRWRSITLRHVKGRTLKAPLGHVKA